MPFYQNIDAATEQGKRTIDRLLKLREKLGAEIPQKQMESNLLLATWNIREFGVTKYGGRSEEASYYIAEIISKFDIVAVQEVRKDLTTLKKLMEILGGYWEYMFTDVTEGHQGNEERLAFIFDTRKVRFGGLAGEMVIPALKTTDPQTGQSVYTPGKQLARTPYLCGFKAGWTNFVLTTVHILYGDNVANDPERIEEIRNIAQSMSRRADEAYEWSRNIVLLGDFNIYEKEDDTLKAITDAKFVIPQELQSIPGSNALKNKFYDQIAFKVRPNRFETSGKAGVFDYFEVVYTLEDEAIYAAEMGEEYEKKSAAQRKTYYKTYWRTFKMSDHLPMWVEIQIDHTDNYLKEKIVPQQMEDNPTATAPSKAASKSKKAKAGTAGK